MARVRDYFLIIRDGVDCDNKSKKKRGKGDRKERGRGPKKEREEKERKKREREDTLHDTTPTKLTARGPGRH